MTDRTAINANVTMYIRDLQNNIDHPLVRERLEAVMHKLSIPQLMIVREWILDAYDTEHQCPKIERLLDFIWGLIGDMALGTILTTAATTEEIKFDYEK